MIMRKILSFVAVFFLGLFCAGCASLLDNGNAVLQNDTEHVPEDASNTHNVEIVGGMDDAAISFDTNGDGVIQSDEFPLPTGSVYGLDGDEAILYDTAATITSMNQSDTANLCLAALSVYDSYEKDGIKFFVCSFRRLYYYELGKGLDDTSCPEYIRGAGGNIALFTINPDGSGCMVKETLDGDDNTEIIREMCGSNAALAETLIHEGTADAREITPQGYDELLTPYLEFYFR